MFSFIYRFFKILVNATFFKNTFPTLTQTSKGLPYYRLTLVERLFWSFFPNIRSINFSLINDTTKRLLNFRKKHFSSFSYKISSYYNFNYNVSLKDFNKYVNFFLIKSSNFFNLKKIFFLKNDYFVVYVLFFFLKRNFYKYFSFLFFKDYNNFNLTKINYIFFRYFYRADIEKSSIDLFNLWKSTDWYNYNFSGEFPLEKNSKGYKNIWLESLKEEWLEKQKHFVLYFTTVLTKFGQNKVILVGKDGYTYLDYLTLNYDYLLKIIVDFNWIKKVKNILPARFSEKSTNKFIDLFKSENYLFFFIRKNKIFNKGRYSRNRQTYRTGFYWSLWLNIFVIYGLHFAFYRFTFNFGYLWIPFIIFFGTFLFARMLKYNFHNYNFIVSEIKKLFIWFGIIIESFFFFFLNCFEFFKNIFFDFLNFLTNTKLTNSKFNFRGMDYREHNVFMFFQNFSKISSKIDFIFDEFSKFFLNFTKTDQVANLRSGKDNFRKNTYKFIFYR